MQLSTTGKADFFLCKGRYDYNHTLEPKVSPAALVNGSKTHTTLTAMYEFRSESMRAAFLADRIADTNLLSIRPFLTAFQKEPLLLAGQECPDLRSFSIDLGIDNPPGYAEHTFLGHPDRVYVDDDHQLCVDEWKTGRDFNRPEQYLVFNPQLEDYSHALTALLGKVPLAYYVFIPSVGRARRVLAPMDIDVNRWKAEQQRAAALMSMAQTGRLPWPQFTRGYHCMTCKFNSLCEARIVGGPEAEDAVKAERYREVQRG